MVSIIQQNVIDKLINRAYWLLLINFSSTNQLNNMRFIGKILITAAAALIAARLLPGVSINSSWTAIILALVLAFLNGIVRPLLILFTIPITVLTLGLFLLIINVVIVKWAATIVTGFHVQNNWAALWFSLLLSFIVYAMEKIIGKPADEKNNGR